MYAAVSLLADAEKLMKLDTLKGNPDAVTFIDLLIKRAKVVRDKTGTGFDEKKQHLPLMKEMIALLCVDAFSKPTDVSHRLESLGFTSEEVDLNCKKLTQPQGKGEDGVYACCIITLACCEVAASTNNGHHHHHHHHHCRGGW